MDQIATREVVVYTAFRDGHESGIDLEPDALTRDHSAGIDRSRLTVKVTSEAVGVIVGELFRWWHEPGNPGGVKLHLICPNCGLQQWGDWRPEVPNPCLWYSDCPCIDKWLIRWNEPISESASPGV